MNIKQYLLVPGLALLTLAACNQEEINTSVHGVTDHDLRTGGLEYGTALMNMHQEVISIGSPAKTTGPGNDLQATDLISSGNYIGYFGNNNNWNNGIEASWNFVDNRTRLIFGELYTKVVQPWVDINKLAKGSDEPQDKRVLAIANITKAVALLRATDAFGPIVYTEIGNGNITPTPDSQEVVYKGLLKELSDAVEVLKDARAPILSKYDLVYDGDPRAWQRFANSLMLRMAVRVHFKDQALAQEYITKAVDPANGGVMTDVSHVAKVASSAKMPLFSPYSPSVEEYGETRMGATMWSYLTGYNDPRISAMYTVHTDPRAAARGITLTHLAVAPTNNRAKDPQVKDYGSRPNLTSKAEVIWMRASEVKFLLAEAALFGLYPAGNVEALYKEGVKMSFEEQGVAGVDAYLANTTGRPTPFSSPNNLHSFYYSEDISAGNVAPAWVASDSQEKKYQRLMTQKYIALYPNAIEAWTEYRRTGYPLIMKPLDRVAPTRVGGDMTVMRAPERFKYSADTYANNPSMSVMPTLLGGPDTGATPLWWVRPNRPVHRVNQ